MVVEHPPGQHIALLFAECIVLNWYFNSAESENVIGDVMRGAKERILSSCCQ
jgi:hypothetical protein